MSSIEQSIFCSTGSWSERVEVASTRLPTIVGYVTVSIVYSLRVLHVVCTPLMTNHCIKDATRATDVVAASERAVTKTKKQTDRRKPLNANYVIAHGFLSRCKGSEWFGVFFGSLGGRGGGAKQKSLLFFIFGAEIMWKIDQRKYSSGIF